MAGASDQALTGDRGSGAGWIAAAAIAIAALIFSLVGLFTPATTGETGPANPNTVVASGPPQKFEVELGDLYVKPNMLDVEAGRPVTLVVTNSASAGMQHDLRLNGTTGTKLLDPGESQEVDLGLVTDGEQAWCTVPGHKAAGMVLTFMVSGSTTGSTTGATAAAAAPASDDATIDPQATPAPDWKPFDPTLQPAPSGTEHKITLHASETVLEVAPGVTQQMFTFNGQVPGPILRGKVGDLFTVTLVNDGKMGTRSTSTRAASPGTTRCAPSSRVSRSSTSSRPTTRASGCTTAARRRRCITSATACTARSSSILPISRQSTTSTCSCSPSSTSGPKASPVI